MLHQVQIRMQMENVGAEAEEETVPAEAYTHIVQLLQVQEDKADIMNMRQEVHTCVVRKMQVIVV